MIGLFLSHAYRVDPSGFGDFARAGASLCGMALRASDRNSAGRESPAAAALALIVRYSAWVSLMVQRRVRLMVISVPLDF